MLAFPAYAGEGGVWLEALTSPEVKERMAEGTDTIIIPTGGTEQNGEHLALGKHNAIVAKTAEMAATMLGKTLVAPVIAYVPETPHMAYAGTISVSDKTFEALLEDAARSFKQHGFKWIVFMGDSSGNQKPQTNVAKRLSKEWEREDVHVVSLADYYANNGEEAWLKSKAMEVKEPAAHAGFLDTAELSATKPDYVREELTPSELKTANAKIGKTMLMLKAQAVVGEIKRLREQKVAK